MAEKKWNVGCSGFYYREWREVFYPKGLPQKAWFSYYCQHFNTLEINNTFYRFPELKNLKGWYEKAPESFVFTIKAPQIITHHKKFAGTEDLVKEFYDVALTGLGNKLGTVLFQLPPSLQYSADKLHVIIRQLDASFTNVIEFRHNSWWRREVMEALDEANICFCGASYPGLVDDVITSEPVSYYRFHGVPKLYHSPYDSEFLENVVSKMKEDIGVKEVFLYFNNTASVAAIDNAKYVQALIQ